MKSLILGISGLALVALIALVLTVARAEVAAARIPRIRRIATLALLVQSIHFIEESLNGFHLRFPEALGLQPWPKSYFVAFNLAWLAIWVVAILSLSSFKRAALFPLWFLAIAAAVNGIAHPLLALADSAYFPGLWTAPFLGILGVALFGSLLSATEGRDG